MKVINEYEIKTKGAVDVLLPKGSEVIGTRMKSSTPLLVVISDTNVGSATWLAKLFICEEGEETEEDLQEMRYMGACGTRHVFMRRYYG